MSELTNKEHEYFHQLMFVLTNAIEPKFVRGATEHRGKGDLWDMSDEDLDTAIREEMLDLVVYYTERIRRLNERKG